MPAATARTRLFGSPVDAPAHATAVIEALDPARCSDADWAGCYALNLAAHQESGTFRMTLAAYRAGHLAPRDGIDHRYWVTRRTGEIVAKANLSSKLDDPTLARLDLHVGARHRRCGIARTMVQYVLERPEALALAELWVGTMHPVGRRICERIGGEVALVGAQRFLELGAVDWSPLERRRADGAKRFPDVRLVEFERLPEAMADAFLSTRNRAWADQPRPAGMPLDVATLEDRRGEERTHALRGWQWSTLVSQEADGSISGITDTQYDPATPELVRQYFTGVAPEHRRRGLASWLKAEMLARIRERYPEAKRVMTNNGADNAPMLAINHALGFGAPIVHHTYRFAVPALRDRLEHG